MPEGKVYSDRSAAIRAARQHMKQIFGPAYEAYEGPDFWICPDYSDAEVRLTGDRLVRGPKRLRFTKPSRYQLRPWAKEAERRKAAGLDYH